ncbi:sorbosone dehydrogenase family protein [Roseivirga sp. BDSF3-8]|uniref:PQQ-dependent sugar dehydrogenase n=1 Tax=Roseivirga sp. BDSF3-8 TaxID=3241598 RepID=UPI0035321363
MPTFRNLLILAVLCFFSACDSGSEESGAVTDDDQVKEQDNGDMNAGGQDIVIDSLPLETIILPEGFKIAHYATGVENARSLAMGKNGTIFVSSRKHDEVRALRDTDGDMVADKMWVVASGLNTPNGVAFREGDLYIAEISRILKLSDIENNLETPGEPEVIYDEYPSDTHHGWKYIAFGPDGKLYVPVGAPCNICESDSIYASITRMNPDGTDMEIFVHGVRNSVGFDWNPQTNELWFTDNGRDMLGDNMPPCELNRAPEKGMHFGYPYCHGGTISDPEFGSKYDCSRFTAPAQNLGPHVAPLGMKFYRGNKFPEQYRRNIFIAEHGSWNRSEKIGYRVTMVPVVDNSEASGYKVFAEGWLNDAEQEAWGRPVDLLEMPDGSFLLSDDKANAVYRIYYEG